MPVLGADMKWQQMGVANDSAQYVESRKYQLEEICRAFGVPPIMIGYSDKASTYASAEQMFLSHVVHTDGWARAAQAFQRWDEVSKAIKEMEEPTSEVGKKVTELANTFNTWEAELTSLGWQSKKVLEIDKKRINALKDYADEVINEYAGEKNNFGGEIKNTSKILKI